MVFENQNLQKNTRRSRSSESAGAMPALDVALAIGGRELPTLSYKSAVAICHPRAAAADIDDERLMPTPSSIPIPIPIPIPTPISIYQHPFQY